MVLMRGHRPGDWERVWVKVALMYLTVIAMVGLLELIIVLVYKFYYHGRL